ncbi:hypothetical protein T492DRAFT_839622 [Pavlovales sp. CCMP2436]|nr:hypothetical protein T492DRAFT_839622 [Pavlovales sp. CCMP2436]
MSTYTLNMLLPAGAISATNFSIQMIKNTSGVSVNRDFNWTSLDSPSDVVAKWQTQMRATVSTLSAAYDRDLAYGTFDNVFYQVDRNFGDDPSNTSLGLFITNSPNVFWQTNMAPREFPNVAQSLEVLATGSLGTTKRPIQFDITRFLDDSAPSLFEADTLFSIIVTTFDILLTEPLGIPISHYPQVYRPVVRVCGAPVVSGAYSGIISPVTLLKVLTNSDRELVLADFGLKNIQASKAKSVNFQGIYGPAANGVIIDVVNSIERLENKVFETAEYVNLLSCTPTTDSWLVTTDNTGADVQYHVTPAYSPTAVNALNKESPTFTNNISILTSTDWSNSSGWRVISSTYWGSAEDTFTSAGVGAARYPGVTAPTEWTVSGSNESLLPK